ncbi:MAG: response regulator transcription factor [Clostridia bacterium]
MIAYVEDDPNIRELVVYTLNQTGLSAVSYDGAQAFYASLAAALPELVLLDIMLPGEDGLSILKHLRSTPRTAQLPVMLLTAKGAEYDKVAGLDQGADDYLAKPFGMAELVARVKALLRRTAPKTGPRMLTIGTLSMDPIRHKVFSDGTELLLTRKEFALLNYLMENTGRTFTREQLLEMVWGYDYEGGTRTVDVHVQTLRSKLGLSGALVETVRGIGYRFGS